MIIEAGERSPQEAAEEALWATFRRRLEQTGGAESLLYLRYFVKANLEQVEAAGPYTRYRFGLYQRASEYSAAYNAMSGERLSWLFDLLRAGSEPGLDRDACLRLARAVAQPPSDAVLEAATFDEQGGATVFVARWAHTHDGTPVEGDFIQVLVNPKTGKPFAQHRKWHRVDFERAER